MERPDFALDQPAYRQVAGPRCRREFNRTLKDEKEIPTFEGKAMALAPGPGVARRARLPTHDDRRSPLKADG